MKLLYTNGRLNVFDLNTLGLPLDNVCENAVNGGHLLILQWLHENEFPWDKYTCACAVQGDHLEILQYLYENGYPWDGTSCALAAKNGKLEITVAT